MPAFSDAFLAIVVGLTHQEGHDSHNSEPTTNALR
jgi:hypothetical protein